MSFDDLGLSAELLRAIADQGYTEPTPIQAQAIPLVLQGRDLMAGAQTGTGKTAGFTLPLLHRLSATHNSSTSPVKHPIRALILTPTRELAIQVQDSVKTYGKHLPLKSTVVFGGVSINTQIPALMTGIDILVATPGRLLDHVEQRSVNLGKVEILVLDEADRMLDMGFLPDLSRILNLLPAKRQNLLFSATFSEDIKRLAEQLMNSPVLIEVARRNAAADTVKQVVFPVDKDRKRELLTHLVKTRDLKQVLVFTRTKHGASRLAYQLERDGIATEAIHGDKGQHARIQALDAFKRGEATVLVATDVAARGLDIEELPHVLNFELPNTPEDYVHRIGRTGRAGSTGDAFSLVSPDEQKLLVEIEKLLKRTIPREIEPGFEHGAAPAASHSEPRARRERSERSERPERGERPERTERGERPERAERSTGERARRPERARKPEVDPMAGARVSQPPLGTASPRPAPLPFPPRISRPVPALLQRPKAATEEKTETS